MSVFRQFPKISMKASAYQNPIKNESSLLHFAESAFTPCSSKNSSADQASLMDRTVRVAIGDINRFESRCDEFTTWTINAIN